MKTTIYNPQKGRLETIDVKITKKNTTWFDDYEKNDGIYMISDHKGGLVIKEAGYSYPVWIYDITRADIDYNKDKAKELIDNIEG